MKTSLALAATLALGTLASASAQTLLLSYNFDGSLANAATTVTTGADLTYHDASGGSTASYVTGVTGTDTALDNGAAGGMGSLATHTGVGAWTSTASASFGSLDTLGSFTIAGWYNAAVQPDGNARILTISGTNSISLVNMYNTNNGQRLGMSYDGFSGSLAASGANAQYAATNQWVFFAVTYDGTSDSLIFYVGGTSGSLVDTNIPPRATTAANFTTGDISLGSALSIGVGNGPASGTNTASTNPFDGSIDNLVFYGGAAGTADGVLSSTQIDALRQASLPVPEPGPVALAIGGLAALLLAGRARAAFRS